MEELAAALQAAGLGLVLSEASLSTSAPRVLSTLVQRCLPACPASLPARLSARCNFCLACCAPELQSQALLLPRPLLQAAEAAWRRQVCLFWHAQHASEAHDARLQHVPALLAALADDTCRAKLEGLLEPAPPSSALLCQPGQRRCQAWAEPTAHAELWAAPEDSAADVLAPGMLGQTPSEQFSAAPAAPLPPRLTAHVQRAAAELQQPAEEQGAAPAASAPARGSSQESRQTLDLAEELGQPSMLEVNGHACAAAAAAAAGDRPPSPAATHRQLLLAQQARERLQQQFQEAQRLNERQEPVQTMQAPAGVQPASSAPPFGTPPGRPPAPALGSMHAGSSAPSPLPAAILRSSPAAARAAAADADMAASPRGVVVAHSSGGRLTSVPPNPQQQLGLDLHPHAQMALSPAMPPRPAMPWESAGAHAAPTAAFMTRPAAASPGDARSDVLPGPWQRQPLAQPGPR